MGTDSRIKRTKSFLDQLVKHRADVVREVKLVLEQAATIRHHMSRDQGPLEIDRTESRSELNPKNYKHFLDYLQIFTEAILPFKRRSFSQGTLVCHPDNPVQEKISAKWFFVNGIATSPPVAILNGKELARLFARPIHLIHTPTQGAIFDLFLSFHARALHKDGALSRPAFSVVKKALLENDRVVLIGHSQGSIVNSYIVRKILKDHVMRKHAHKLEIYSLAGIADSFKVDVDLSNEAGRPVPYVEHFANEGDFFARIGILAHRETTEGTLFRLDQRGHLLNEHYLSHLNRGEYCNGQSRLFKYLHGGQPGSQDYLVASDTYYATQENHLDATPIHAE